MPFLDVSDVLLDPVLADQFDVNRRLETIDTHGRSKITDSVLHNVIGVITMASPNDLQRLPEDQLMGRHLSIVTKFRLRGPTPNYQPDTIVWEGDTYVVKWVDLYPRFGAGFIQAIVGSMDLIDQPATEPAA